MKDSLAITAQAIPFLNDFKNFTYLCINITYRKDNTFWTYCKKKRTHFPANPFTEIKNVNYIEYQISKSAIIEPRFLRFSSISSST